MKGSLRLAAATLLVVPGIAGAQAECDADLTNPPFLGRAYITLTQAGAIVGQNGDATPQLHQVLNILTDPRARDRDRNPIGQQLMRGQAYILLLGSGAPATVRAGDIGIQANQEETIDLIVAADTLFRNAQTAHPACADMINEFRRFRPWVDMLNAAINAVNAGQADTAEVLARRSLLLYTDAPYAHSLLGTIAQQRQQYGEALTHFRTALELAQRDTTFADVVASTRGDIARTLYQRAQSAPAAEQAALAREAITAYNEYLAEQGLDDLTRSVGIAQLAVLYPLSGNAAGVRSVYAPILENPAAHGENTLLQAGGVAMSAQAYADAARLFSAAHALNPHHRDVLNNLAASLIGSEQYAQSFPLVRQLIELEPNNPDAVLLYGYGYTGLLQATRDAALRRAYTDSLVKYTTLSEQMPITVTFTEFSRLRTETRLAGAVANRGRTPKSFTLTIELLGREGQVVGTQETNLGPIAAGATESFRMTFPIAREEVFGYRYRRLE
jgi:tetratricopeptide (TPR) repeat protein